MMTACCDICETEAPATPKFSLEAWTAPQGWTPRTRVAEGGSILLACPNPECVKALDAKLRAGNTGALQPVHEVGIRATYNIGALDPPEKVAALVVIAGRGAGEALGKKMTERADKLAGHTVSLNMMARARLIVPTSRNGVSHP